MMSATVSKTERIGWGWRNGRLLDYDREQPGVPGCPRQVMEAWTLSGEDDKRMIAAAPDGYALARVLQEFIDGVQPWDGPISFERLKKQTAEYLAKVEGRVP